MLWNRIDDIPDDDEDLVFRAVHWYKRSGDKIIERFRQYHPRLLDRVLLAIAKSECRKV